MTVTTNVSRATFNGTGSVGPFTFNFRFVQDADIVVNRTTSGVTSTLVEGVDYTLTGAGSYAGGAVTLTVALAIGEFLTVLRSVSLLQERSFRNLGAFFPEIHEDSFDQLVMMIQQVNDFAATTQVVAQGATVTNRTDIAVDCSGGPVNCDIKNYTAVTVTKDDTTANAVTVFDSSGATVLRQANVILDTQDAWVNLIKVGTNWKRIG